MTLRRIKMLIFLNLQKMSLWRSRGHRPSLAKAGGVYVLNPSKTFIGEGVIFDTNYPDDIVVEEGVRITARCILLTHFMEPASGTYSRGKIHIKKRAYIGCNTVICKPVTIGEDAIVGAGSVVTKDIPAGEVWAGNPAGFIRKRVLE
ncbi:acyltransferase [Porphyromonas gingivalis]|uniref:acyltransferase n=1 Tax=Porphyromonas gingivalis TaxID=837 RepID=UPI000974FC77|nr:acyltransferase [Porphyromonas gingivalis]SJL27034.1 hexapeptide transferase [Porphyromonas gingivalis]